MLIKVAFIGGNGVKCMSWLYLTEVGAKLGMKEGHYVISRGEENIAEIPAEIVEGITLIDKVQVSSKIIVDCLERNVPVTWLSTEGQFFGRLESTSNRDILQVKAQFEALENYAFRLDLSRMVVFRKIYNQRTILRNYNRRAKSTDVRSIYEKIGILMGKIRSAGSVDEIMGYEGAVSRLYFKALNVFLPREFQFERRTRRPPRDYFNSMLSFGYTLLLYDFYNAIVNSNMNPYIGFLHTLHKGHPALASDLMEPWRAAVVDSFCLAMVTHHEIDDTYFIKNDDNGGVYLNRVGRRIFLKAYERKMRSMNSYFNGKYSWRHTVQMECDSYRQAIHKKDPILLRAMVIR